MYDHRNDYDDIRRMRQRQQSENLTISKPGDADEKEADEVARKVTNGESAEVQGSSSGINRKGTDEAEVTSGLQSQLENSKGSGSSLSPDLQQEMGSKMNADFSGVKVHTDSDAHNMNESVQAKAFTHGQDIYFRQGAYDTQSPGGKELLAHELVHTKQQGENAQMIHRSAVVDKKKQEKKVVVSGNINYYGAGADEAFAQAATNRIMEVWNAANGTVTFKEKKRRGKEKDVLYAVQFKFTYNVYPPAQYTNAQIQQIAIGKAGDPGENYVRVVPKKERPGQVSSMSNNQGTFLIEGSDRAEYAHEFGHGMGLQAHVHGPAITVVDDETGKEYQGEDFRGITSIMIGGPDEDANNYSLMDPEFMKDPQTTVTPDANRPGVVHTSSGGAKLDPNKRRASQSDINNLKIKEALGDGDHGVLNGKGSTVEWWGGEGENGRTQLPTMIPNIDPATYNESINIIAMKQTGKKDAQFIQPVFISFRSVGFPMDDNYQRFFENPQKGQLVDNSLKPGMADLYTPGTIRYVYFDRQVPDRELNFHPVSVVDGLPASTTDWVKGFSQPEPVR